ncbi:MAG TPA: hypothetical protein VK911_07810 [Vicinamibacterales bacterium]|nr:hypothetical protein [Vicinamibacterales bacterium]
MNGCRWGEGVIRAAARSARSFRILLVAWLAVAGTAAAQPPVLETTGGTAGAGGGLDTVRVFLDCKDTPCYYDYVRVEIAYVDYVNVREAADVHVLVTSLATGAGGREFAFKFVGQGPFAGVNDEVVFVSWPTETEESVRRGFVQTLKLGLVRYVLHTGVRQQLRLHHEAPEPGIARATGVRSAHDPWDYWVLRARFNANYDSEASNSSRNVNGSFSANRTTANWKISLSTYRDARHSEYTYSDGTGYISDRTSYDLTGQAIKSLGNHWAAGGKAYVAGSTYENKDRVLNATTGVEYNFFPYADSTRRQLTLQYLVGLTSFDYLEETVFGEIEETVPSHTFRSAFDLKQTWGSLSADAHFSQYLHDRTKKRWTLSAEMDVRLFKGLALNMSGRTSSIHDQLYLPKGDASPEEILARQRQVATSYRRAVRVGVSYTFGSIFSTVVNTRLSNFVGG